MDDMCGRFAVTTDPALLAGQIQALDETAAAGDRPNYNVAPTTTISAVVKRHSEPGDESTRRIRSMRWGLVPPWARAGADGAPERKGPLLINARAETITSSPAFRGAARHKRCLVPMNGWYEWQPTGAVRGPKTPYYLYAADGGLLLMAGLWSAWRPGNAPATTPPLLSCTIITTDAVGPLARIHDRMPLSVSAGDWDRWLDPDAPVDEGLLAGHGDSDRIAVREVSTLVNNTANNGPELIEPADTHQGAPLSRVAGRTNEMLTTTDPDRGSP